MGKKKENMFLCWMVVVVLSHFGINVRVIGKKKTREIKNSQKDQKEFFMLPIT